MTNRDTLNKMTNKELASIVGFLDCMLPGFVCPYFHNPECGVDGTDETCKRSFEEWLNTEVKQDDKS